MDILLCILSLILALLGIAGAILPILPGPVLSLAGLLCAYLCDHSLITREQMLLWLAITIAVTIIDYFLPVYMTKWFGGSRKGVVGATLGLVVGFLTFPPFGVIICPFFGAVLGELLNDKSDVERAFKVAFGSFLAFIVGSGMKLVASFWMLALFINDLVPYLIDWFEAILQ